MDAMVRLLIAAISLGCACQLHQWLECPLVERGDGVAVISFNDFMKRRDVSRSECANGLKQVELLWLREHRARTAPVTL